MKLYIKNMACDSCIVLVRKELEDLDIQPVKVSLGEAEVKGKPSVKKLANFNEAIQEAGLELVQNKESILIDKIKVAIFEFVANKKKINVNLSDFLSNKLHYDYPYLSSYFSTVSASTIEQYMISLKIEKAKELLLFSDQSLSQIADNLGYSSVSHLSNQFKKVTGLPASHFKRLKTIRRTTIQRLLDK